MKDRETLLEVRNISKRFPGVIALSDVSFSLAKGEMRALCGENGAGKSTMIKILTGIYARDAGEVYFKNRLTNYASSQAAQKDGISTVYQELNLIPYLTVAENIYLGAYPMNRLGIDWKKLMEMARALLQKLNLNIDPAATLGSLGAAAQQMVAIARALRDDQCELLILDEPTSSLDGDEVEMLFTFLRQLKERGVSQLFITHRLEEIFRVCDSATVLKDGKYVGTFPIDELDQHKLVAHMLGREVEDNAGMKRVGAGIDRSGTPILEVEHLRCAPVIRDVSFKIYPGEIVGLAGLLGSGRTETARAIYGCDKPDGGVIRVEGKPVHISSPAKALGMHIAFCTENRRYDGIIPNMDVKNNTVLNNLSSISRLGIINSKKRADKVRYYVDKFAVKTPTIHQQIKFLSGGNQQKVILARALACDPKLIILDEPTRGIDVGAKAEIEALIQSVAASGIGVLFISSELSEVVRNSDRVVVMRDGRSVGELTGADITMQNITATIASGGKERGEERHD